MEDMLPFKWIVQQDGFPRTGASILTLPFASNVGMVQIKLI
jgi:hypothetical protein